MKIENAVELKTFPEIEVQSFLLVFRFNFFQLSEKCVYRLPWLKTEVWKHELHETFVDNDLKNGNF